MSENTMAASSLKRSSVSTPCPAASRSGTSRSQHQAPANAPWTSTILAIVSGANRVDEGRLGELLAEPVAKADAEYVRQRTGYAIGGVPPVGHAESLVCLVDEDLLQYEQIWAAAGTPRAVFQLTPADLQRITDGRVVSVAARRLT